MPCCVYCAGALNPADSDSESGEWVMNHQPAQGPGKRKRKPAKASSTKKGRKDSKSVFAAAEDYANLLDEDEHAGGAGGKSSSDPNLRRIGERQSAKRGKSRHGRNSVQRKVHEGKRQHKGKASQNKG